MADTCGGDWWTYRPLSDGRLLLVIGDVTGHGTSSAMVAATARGAMEGLRSSTPDSQITPSKVLESMDDAIRGVAQINLMMTCFAAIVDPVKQVLEIANAGHLFPHVATIADGTIKGLKQIATRGNPLGYARRAFGVAKAAFKPNDVLIVITDGLTDRLNGEGVRFGDRRYRVLLNETHVTKEPVVAAEQIRDMVLTAVNEFGGPTKPDDDITIAVLHFHGQQQQVEMHRVA
jgi:serine phosphatase RsbU (regulator of sigma subunit)